MLEKIIQIIKEGRLASIAQISEQLGVDSEMTRAMLDELVRMNYLKRTEAEACSCGSEGGSSCGGCSGSCSCGSSLHEAEFWELV